jgi:hypothetical protein
MERKRLFEYTEKEKDLFVKKNEFYLKKLILSDDKEKEKIEKFLFEETNKLGFESMTLVINNFNDVEMNSAFLVSNPIKTIDKLLVLEKGNKENSKILKQAKKTTQILFDVSEGTIDIFFMNNNMEAALGARNYLTNSEYLGEDMSRERLDKVKENSMDKEVLTAIKKIELQRLYADKFEYELIDELISDYLRMEMQKLRILETYINNKFEKLRKVVEKKVRKMSSHNSLKKFASENELLFFNIQGHLLNDAFFKQEKKSPRMKVQFYNK